MNNKEIANTLKLLGDLMELHGEADFKTKSYFFAARTLKSIDVELSTLTVQELEQIQGIGKAIAAKIFELTQTGTLHLLETYLQKTPSGIVELFQIKGIGAKKIKLLWDELGIESMGELLYACNENRLITIKGFGAKTQQAIKEQIEFIHKNANSFLWANLEEFAIDIIESIQNQYPELLIDTVGDFANKKQTLEKIELLIATTNVELQTKLIDQFRHFPIQFHFCTKDDFYLNRIKLSSSKQNFEKLIQKINTPQTFISEADIYEQAQLSFIPTELRDLDDIYSFQNFDDLIQLKDIKGIIHTHTKYSDGSNTIEEMAKQCMAKGYSYLVISDHSKSAFYANGMKEETIIQQHLEIDKLNKKYTDFKIYKSIESDILYNGDLDYDVDILKTFDLVIASIHSNLKMNEEKAMERLIKAIENPYTTILGHLTGRLLLSRKGYPIDTKKIIDACAANNIVIELNANPHRLDIDYTWLNYCQEKNVKIAINPDAHNLEGINDIRFGVIAARKGLLLKDNTLNTLNINSFDTFLLNK